MSHGVCPWWMGYLLASPFRRWGMQNPEKLLRPWIKPGCTILEPGPGMGFFTVPMARMCGEAGRVIALDVQSQMLAGLQRRATRAGVAKRVETRQVASESLGVSDLANQIDFVLAFAVVHEMPSAWRFFAEVATTMKPDAHLFLAEPAGHVAETQFDEELSAAAAAGLEAIATPKVARSRSLVFRKR